MTPAIMDPFAWEQIMRTLRYWSNGPGTAWPLRHYLTPQSLWISRDAMTDDELPAAFAAYGFRLVEHGHGWSVIDPDRYYAVGERGDCPCGFPLPGASEEICRNCAQAGCGATGGEWSCRPLAYPRTY